MKKYKCKVCGYVYDPEAGEPRRGIAPGTPFEDLKNEWRCPQCGAGLNRFIPASRLYKAIQSNGICWNNWA